MRTVWKLFNSESTSFAFDHLGKSIAVHWCTILQWKILQSGTLSLEAEAANVRDLKNEMQNIRDSWDTLFSEEFLIERDYLMRPLALKKVGMSVVTKCFATLFFFTAVYHSIWDLDTCFQTTADIVEEFAAIIKLGQLCDSDIATVSTFTLAQKKLYFLLTSDTNRNLSHMCKHKNQNKIRFFCIRS